VAEEAAVSGALVAVAVVLAAAAPEEAGKNAAFSYQPSAFSHFCAAGSVVAKAESG
jgi:hypothetical protein